MNFTVRSIALGCAFAIAGCAQGAGLVPSGPSAGGGGPLLRSHRQSSSGGPQIYVFGALPDAQTPEVGITNIGNTIYGTTYGGGANNEGALYSVTS